MNNTDNHLRLLELVQLWRMNMLNAAELAELEVWYRSLEDKALGPPTEMAVDDLEKRLHELLNRKIGNDNKDDNGPPNPFL